MTLDLLSTNQVTARNLVFFQNFKYNFCQLLVLSLKLKLIDSEKSCTKTFEIILKCKGWCIKNVQFRNQPLTKTIFNLQFQCNYFVNILKTIQCNFLSGQIVLQKFIFQYFLGTIVIILTLDLASYISSFPNISFHNFGTNSRRKNKQMLLELY